MNQIHFVGYEGIHSEDFKYDIPEGFNFYLLVITTTPALFRVQGKVMEYPLTQQFCILLIMKSGMPQIISPMSITGFISHQMKLSSPNFPARQFRSRFSILITVATCFSC